MVRILEELTEKLELAEEVEKLVEEMAEKILAKPMCVKAEHKPEWDAETIETVIMGHPLAVKAGICNILRNGAREIARQEDKDPREVVRQICRDAIEGMEEGI